jgi:hypothetical protein
MTSADYSGQAAPFARGEATQHPLILDHRSGREERKGGKNLENPYDVWGVSGILRLLASALCRPEIAPYNDIMDRRDLRAFCKRTQK